MITARWPSLLIFCICACLVPEPVRGQIQSGSVIGAKDAARVQNLVSPGVYWAVQHDMRMKIIPTTALQWPPPYKDATERYSAQVRLSDDRRTVVGYVAGLPFTNIDVNDPDAGIKLMWDVQFAPLFSDDLDMRYSEGDSVYVRPGAQPEVLEHFVYGHYASYNEIGRCEVEPMPYDPDFKATGRTWMMASYPTLEPQASRGEGLIRYRYADPSRADDIWSWIPGTRRQRRVNEAQMSNPTGAQTFDLNHLLGFHAKIEGYRFRMLGEKPMLASMNVDHLPVHQCPYDGGATACPENWEMRRIYIVEATPRRSTGAEDNIESRNVLFVDSEMFFAPYIDIYNRRGELWRTWLSVNGYKDRSWPESRLAIFPFPRILMAGTSVIDMQKGLASTFFAPARQPQNDDERNCWYINMGALDKSFFTVDAMVKAAP